MFVQYNANPTKRKRGDCTVRAISKALGQSWDDTYTGLCVEGFIVKDMPSGNHVWGNYLRKNGFVRHAIPEDFPDDYTVEDFCNEHFRGTYILALETHVIAVKDGDWYDTWDSGQEQPIYYWEREDE